MQTNDSQYKLKSIWFFLGLILALMGLVVFGTGIYNLVTHQPSHTVLGNLHPDLWWGGLVTFVGLIFFIVNK